MLTIKQNVMARVRFLFYLKLFFQPVVLETLVVAVFAVLAASFVSVGHVIANSISLADRLAVLQFFFEAFLNTEFVVQVSILAVLVAGVFLLRDIYRLLRAGEVLVLGRQLA